MLRQIDHTAEYWVYAPVIRVLVVGDVRLHREGLAALIALDSRVTVSALAATADGASREPASVDVIVVDAATYEEPERLRELADVVQEPIVALGVPSDERRVIALAEVGVLGFVEREASLEELVASILSAARGEASFPPPIAMTLLRRVTSLAVPKTSPEADVLTARERQVVEIIAEGLSNKEIAARLSIEVATVKNHVHNILEKLKVTGRAEAVARLRLVEGGERASAMRSRIGSRTG